MKQIISIFKFLPVLILLCLYAIYVGAEEGSISYGGACDAGTLSGGSLYGSYIGSPVPPLGFYLVGDPTWKYTEPIDPFDPSDYELSSTELKGEIRGGTLFQNPDGGAITMEGEAHFIEGNSWGIWGMEFESLYQNPFPTDWQTQVGGAFGLENGYSYSYFMTDVLGKPSSEFGFQGTLIGGHYLTPGYQGSLSGELIGNWNGETPGIWQGVTLGTWESDPLKFTGLYIDKTSAGMNGIFGGTESLWSGNDASVMVLGDYADINMRVWLGEVKSYNHDTELDTTYEQLPGAFFGFMGGTADDKSRMTGKMLALYIDPEGNSGYLKSTDLIGSLSQDLQLFKMDGTIGRDADYEISDVSPDTLTDSVSAWNYPLPILGNIVVGGPIEPGNKHSSNSQGFETRSGGAHFGVWSVTTEGAYVNDSGAGTWEQAYIKNKPGTYFMAGTIHGEDDLVGHLKITGELVYLDHQFRGRIELTYNGIYDETGYQSVGLGTFRLVPLFAGLDTAAHQPLQDAIDALFVLQAAVSALAPVSTVEGMFTQEQLNQAVLGERQRWDVNGDNRKGLEDAIEILQVLSGIRTGQ